MTQVAIQGAFPRGETWKQFSSVIGTLLVGTPEQSLMGRRIWVPDTIHGKGAEVELVCLQNQTGGDITVARDFAQFGTSAYDFGRVCGAFGTGCSAGLMSLALDDAYTVGRTIEEFDLFWCIAYGWATVRTAAAAVANQIHTSVACDANGRIKATAAADTESICGYIDQAQTAEDTAVTMFATGFTHPYQGT